MYNYMKFNKSKLDKKLHLFVGEKIIYTKRISLSQYSILVLDV